MFASVDGGGPGSAVLIGTPPFIKNASGLDKWTVLWAQFNDLGGGEDVSLENFGTAGLYHVAAALMNAQSETVAIVDGINSTHPATFHAWRSDGTVKILLGNLEGAYCAGSPIVRQKFGYTSGCSIPIEAQGGFAGGTPLSLTVRVNPTKMGLGALYAACMKSAHQQWSLRCLDGMRTPLMQDQHAKGIGASVQFERMEMAPREAHAFELVCNAFE